MIQDIEVQTIPLKFVQQIKVELRDGNTIIFTKNEWHKYETFDDFIKDQPYPANLKSISFQWDFDLIEEMVNDSVDGIVNKVRKSDD